jgi:hypothetical protein
MMEPWPESRNGPQEKSVQDDDNEEK